MSNNNAIKISLLGGEVAPRYETKVKALTCDHVIITEHGMASGLPLVDIQFHDEDGNQFFFALSGSMLMTMGAAVKGINIRNFGNPDPSAEQAAEVMAAKATLERGDQETH